MLKNEKNHNCEVRYEDDTTVKIHANQLHNLGIDLFKDWSCHAGFDRIYIDVDEKIYGGECMNDCLGNLNDWDLLPNPTKCRLKTCTGCTDDLMIRKYKDRV